MALTHASGGMQFYEVGSTDKFLSHFLKIVYFPAFHNEFINYAIYQQNILFSLPAVHVLQTAYTSLLLLITHLFISNISLCLQGGL